MIISRHESLPLTREYVNWVTKYGESSSNTKLLERRISNVLIYEGHTTFKDTYYGTEMREKALDRVLMLYTMLNQILRAVGTNMIIYYYMIAFLHHPQDSLNYQHRH